LVSKSTRKYSLIVVAPRQPWYGEKRLLRRTLDVIPTIYSKLRRSVFLGRG
jgi:hypothetical protein